MVKRRLPTVATTRWNYSSRLVNTVYSYRFDLILLFEEMIDDPDTWGADAIQARGFLQFLNTFNTVFMLNIFHNIFSFTDVLFDILQNKTFDIQYCCEHIETTKKQILESRSKFNDVFNSAKDAVCPAPKRGENLESVKLRYKQVFYQIIDTLHAQMDTRFQSLQNLKFVELLNSKKYNQYQKKIPIETCMDVILIL